MKYGGPASEPMISEASVEAALDWLRDNAEAIGKARARAVNAGHMIKHVEALEYKMSSAKTEAAKKADARTSERYVEAINEDAEAAGEFTRMTSLREAAALKIESWQTQSANFRAMKL